MKAKHIRDDQTVRFNSKERVLAVAELGEGPGGPGPLLFEPPPPEAQNKLFLETAPLAYLKVWIRP